MSVPHPVLIGNPERVSKLLRKLNKKDRDAIVDAIRLLAREGKGDIVKLKGQLGFWRLRVGEFRVVFCYLLNVDSSALVVKEIGPRGDVYK